jgi:integrase/recombinase XerD
MEFVMPQDLAAPHDMRRTFAKLCRKRGGEIEQIEVLLGHGSRPPSVIWAEQNFISAVNDNLGLDRNKRLPAGGYK